MSPEIMRAPASENIGSRFSTKVAYKRWVIVALITVAIAVGLYLRGEQGIVARQSTANRRSAVGAQTVPVLVAKAEMGSINDYLTGLGTVTPLATANVKTRVDGQVMKVLYREGQMVRAGEPLVEIDPRPYQVQLEQAEGQLARDQALLNNAQTDLERYKVLFAQDSVPKQQLDTQASLVRQYEAAIKSDQAQVDNAKLQLTYSHVTAPIGGRIGLRLVDVGNVVRAADTTSSSILAVITQLQPITVLFTIPEGSLPPVLAKLKAGAQLPVEAYDQERKQKLATGVLLTIDNQIDPTTGTVKLKAQFANTDGALFPNQFVNARLLVNTIDNTVLIPNAAIQHSPRSAYVYVVKPDSSVEARNVNVKLAEGDKTAIASGLTAGEVVVIDGIDKLQPGARVSVRTPGASS